MSKNRPTPNLIHIVDDEETLRNSLNFLLRTAGFRVERWKDGESFLKGVNLSEPSCVVLDLRMPKLDGLAVQRRMAESGIDFPVIILTGHGDIDIAVQAMKAGAADFLVKPLCRETLLRSVTNALQLSVDRSLMDRKRDWAGLQIAKLTEREREVLDGLACGYPNKTIAYDLGISSRTVEVYRANVMAKLNAATFADTLRIAFLAGLGSEAMWLHHHQHPAGTAKGLSAGSSA